MPGTKECPKCGGEMSARRTEATVQIPGNPDATEYRSEEWLCPDCDYFEEVEEDA